MLEIIKLWYFWYGYPYFPFHKRCWECGGNGKYINSYDERICGTCEGKGKIKR